MNVSVIILAAGMGKRMNAGMNKQFLTIRNKAILSYTIEAFLKIKGICEVVLVINNKEEKRIEDEVLSGYREEYPGFFKTAYGGAERYNSVFNGLKEVSVGSEIVLIHDGARPLVSEKEVLDSIAEVKRSKACVLGVKAKNTYKLVDDEGYVKETIPREFLYSILTPQSFDKELIIDVYEKGIHNPSGITDDAMMVEKYSDVAVKIIEGSYENIKITTADDLLAMEKIIEEREKNKKV